MHSRWTSQATDDGGEEWTSPSGRTRIRNPRRTTAQRIGDEFDSLGWPWLVFLEGSVIAAVVLGIVGRLRRRRRSFVS
jgi:hypothetical protein